MHGNGEQRYTTITWDEYVRLSRDSEILADLSAARDRGRPGQSLRRLVEAARETKRTMNRMLARAVKRLPDPPKPARAEPPATIRMDYWTAD